MLILLSKITIILTNWEKYYVKKCSSIIIEYFIPFFAVLYKSGGLFSPFRRKHAFGFQQSGGRKKAVAGNFTERYNSCSREGIKLSFSGDSDGLPLLYKIKPVCKGKVLYY
jgi:hypothetical protein